MARTAGSSDEVRRSNTAPAKKKAKRTPVKPATSSSDEEEDQALTDATTNAGTRDTRMDRFRADHASECVPFL